jgi:hypothetical protein
MYRGHTIRRVGLLASPAPVFPGSRTCQGLGLVNLCTWLSILRYHGEVQVFAASASIPLALCKHILRISERYVSLYGDAKGFTAMN